ncbi:MAG TPA: methyltransferase domain-containing protein [Candidatus Gastranaerophilales bacterium]|nr:methyltransferase domain-containing protein [Candidatus Gastranaerophilales bacterium]
MINLSVNFRGISNSENYNICYIDSRPYNGAAPDQKILSTITENFPDPKNVSIVDIAAGEGRNTIPLAQKGYNLLALELCSVGRDEIRKKADFNRFENINISGHDITKQPLNSKNDAFIMSHLTQHLNSEEMNSAFANISKSIKPKGILLFDSLINYGEPLFKNTKVDQEEGCCRFTMSEIKEMAEKNGFKLKEIVPYEETGASRAKYIDQRRWGGPGMHESDRFRHARRPVYLKWFLFEKT